MPSSNHDHDHHGDSSHYDCNHIVSSGCDFKVLFSINANDILNVKVRDNNNNDNNNNNENNYDNENIRNINSFCHRYQHQLICRNIFNHLKRDCITSCHEWDIITSKKILNYLHQQQQQQPRHQQDRSNHDHRRNYSHQEQQQQQQQERNDYQHNHHHYHENVRYLDNNMRDTLLYEDLSNDNIIVITITNDTIILRVSESLYLCYQLIDCNHHHHYHNHHHDSPGGVDRLNDNNSGSNSKNNHGSGNKKIVNYHDNNNNNSNYCNNENNNIVFHQSFIKILSLLFLYTHIYHDPNINTISIKDSKQLSLLPIINSTNMTSNMIQKIFHLFFIQVHKFRINYYVTSQNNKHYSSDSRVTDDINDSNDDNINTSDDMKYYVKWSTINHKGTNSSKANKAHKLFSTFYYGTIYQTKSNKANLNNSNYHKINVVVNDDDIDDDNDRKNKKKDKEQDLKVIIRLQFSISSSHFLHILQKIKIDGISIQQSIHNVGLLNIEHLSTTSVATIDFVSTTADTIDTNDAIFIDRLIHETFYKSEDNIDDDSISKCSYITIKHIHNLHQFVSYFESNIL